jgi:hypothetical protein
MIHSSDANWEECQKYGKSKINAYCFWPIESGLCTAVDFERFDLRLWGKYHHVLLDVLQVS